MNFSNNTNIAILKGLKDVQAGLWRIARLPIVDNNEAAGNFIKGYRELMRLDKETRKKIGDMSVEELNKSEYSTQIKTAVGVTSKALKSVSDATSNRAGQNERIQAALKEKSMHTETRSNFAQAVELVDQLSSMTQENGIDAGWMMAYQPKQVLGKDEMEVRDIIGQVRFNQLGRTERVILTGLGSEESEKVGYDRFGGGVKYMHYDQANSAYTVNEILTAIRIAYLQMQAWVAYKEIFRQGADNAEYAFKAHPKEGTNTTTKDKSYDWTSSAIHTLNESFRMMKLEAGQIRTSPQKKGTDNQDQAPLLITPATTGIVYYNEAHATLVDQMKRMSGGDDNINSRLMHNFVFLPTHLSPISGGWKVEASKQRDEFGAFGKVSEYAAIGKTDSGNYKPGVRLVIPGQRNLHGMFQGLSFAQETSFLDEETTVAAYAREKFVTDSRQTARVALEA